MHAYASNLVLCIKVYNLQAFCFSHTPRKYRKSYKQ